MSTALDILHAAEDNGISVWAAEGKLRYSPRQAPEDILEALREHKAELIAMLSGAGAVSLHAENPHRKRVGLHGLTARFVDGQARLERDRGTLDALPDAGVGSEAEHAYCALFADVIAVETLLGFVYPSFDGCARGDAGPCAPLAIVRCAYCAEGSA